MLWGMVLALPVVIVSTFWISGPPGANPVVVIFLGYTNAAPSPANAVLRLENKSKESIQVMRGVTLEFLPGGDNSRWQEIDREAFWLAPNATRDVYICAPTNGAAWRAEVAFIGQRQVDRKLYIAKQVRRSNWVRKHMAWYLQLIPEHVRTRWVDPSTEGTGKQ